MLQKKTIIAFSILVLIVGYYYLFEVRLSKYWEEKKEKAKKVLLIEKDKIQSLKITRDNKQIVCQKTKDKDEWIIVEPLKAKCDDNVLDNIVSSLVRANIEETVDSKPEDCGLSPSKLKVYIGLKDKTTEHVLLLGDYNPADSYVYAQRDNNPQVLLISRYLYGDLDKKLYDLRDKTLFNFETDNVRRCSIKKLNLKKDLNNQWWVAEGKKIKGNKEKIEELLDKIKDWEVKEFVSETSTKLKKYGLIHPETEINIWTGQEMALNKLILGKKKNDSGIYAKKESLPDIYLLDTGILDDLSISTTDYEDHSMLKKGQPEKLD